MPRRTPSGKLTAVADVEGKLKKEYPNNPGAVFGTLNKIGLKRGSKTTAKGLKAAKAGLVLLALLWALPAAAQNAFTPTGPTVNFSVTATSSRVQTQATPSGPNTRVYNSGTVAVFLVCGDVTAVATTAGIPIAPAAVNIIGCPSTYVAGIGSTAATVYLTPGFGN